jgi:hypothetical protein
MRAYNAGDSERVDRLWENLRAIWSQAWSANYAVLKFMQGTGLTRFSPVKPQHWVIASFEHHTSPHGLPRHVLDRCCVCGDDLSAQPAMLDRHDRPAVLLKSCTSGGPETSPQNLQGLWLPLSVFHPDHGRAWRWS